MKAKFPGYFRLSKTASNKLWDEGLICLDASVLLDSYRYSESTREELLKLLGRLRNRLWIPHQAAQEFLDNRCGVIWSQAEAYQDSQKQLESIERSFKSSRGHPFLSDAMLKEVSKLFEKVKGHLQSRQQELEKLIIADPIQDAIVALVEGKIGEPFSPQRMTEIKAEGEERYKTKIPPGYLDKDKPEEKKCGDLIVWLQLIEQAKRSKKGITFVTSDTKDDWWWTFKGKTLGPRPELVAELRLQAGADLQMYSVDSFIQHASEKVGTRVKPEAIKEVREISDERRRFRERAFRERFAKNLARSEAEEAFVAGVDAAGLYREKLSELSRHAMERASAIASLRGRIRHLHALVDVEKDPAARESIVRHLEELRREVAHGESMQDASIARASDVARAELRARRAAVGDKLQEDTESS